MQSPDIQQPEPGASSFKSIVLLQKKDKKLSNHLCTVFLQDITAEAFLNWIEVWRVWWQDKKNTTKALNDFSKCMHLVNRTVVKDQDTLVLRKGIHCQQLE